MPTRFILAGMQLFAIAAALGVAVALIAPIDPVRFLGVVAFAFAGTGFLVQLYALQQCDPQAYRVFACRFRAALKRVSAFGARGVTIVAAAIHHVSSPRSAR